MELSNKLDFEKVMRWNEDVERRRLAYHQRRCGEDPIYKRVYERQQEMMQRLAKANAVAQAQLANAMACNMDEKRNQRLSDQMEDNAVHSVRPHEDLMKKRADLADAREQCEAGSAALFAGSLLAGMLAKIFGGESGHDQWMEVLKEESPYVQEIRLADQRFDNMMIRMSGFAW